MQRLSRTKRDIIWTKTPSKPREHTKGWQEMAVQIISKSNQHMIEDKWLRTNQINIWLNPKHINTWSVISKGIESKQHIIDKTPIENKIPTRRKDTKEEDNTWPESSKVK